MFLRGRERTVTRDLGTFPMKRGRWNGWILLGERKEINVCPLRGRGRAVKRVFKKGFSGK